MISSEIPLQSAWDEMTSILLDCFRTPMDPLWWARPRAKGALHGKANLNCGGATPGTLGHLLHSGGLFN